MITFTVHEPPHPPADRIERAAGMAFVRDGFSWSAALLAPVWMIAHRLWWPLAAYVAVMMLIARVGLELHPGWPTLAMLALGLLIGLEAGTLRRWSLERRGWTTLGTVSGHTVEDCERRFFDVWLATAPSSTTNPSPADDTPSSRARRSLLGALSATQG